MKVLVVNAGSSSLKLRVVASPGDDVADGGATEGGDVDDEGVVVASRDLEAPDEHLGDELASFLDASPAVDAVGHRVVHGGSEFTGPLVVDEGTDAALERLGGLAPLHNPAALRAIHELRRHRPQLVQVACFDTTFHATLPERAATYALPRRWREDWGVRKFGFHGLSHAWASRRAARLLGVPLDGARMVTAHVGAGASLAAVAGERSIDTTMGFSPIDGLVMATRSGSVDPAAVLAAVRQGLDADEVEQELERRSGLLALAGTTDLRDVIARADQGDLASTGAYAVYVYRLQTAVGAMAVALGRVDALVFTGGAGEASARLRRDVCDGLAVLGICAPSGDDPARASAPSVAGDRILSARGAQPAVVVVRAREDLEIARNVRTLLSSRSGS